MGRKLPVRPGYWGLWKSFQNETLERFAEGDKSSLNGPLGVVSSLAPDLVENGLLAAEQAWRTWFSGHTV